MCVCGVCLCCMFVIGVSDVYVFVMCVCDVCVRCVFVMCVCDVCL